MKPPFLNVSIQIEDFSEDWALPPGRHVHFRWGRLRMGRYDSANGIYFIERVPSKHFLVKLQSYGVSVKILKILRFNGCLGICLTEKGKSGTKQFGANLMLFFNSGLSWHNNVWPFDDQKQLPIRSWTALTGRWKPSDFTTKLEPEVLTDVYPI